MSNDLVPADNILCAGLNILKGRGAEVWEDEGGFGPGAGGGRETGGIVNRNGAVWRLSILAANNDCLGWA
jgi:hypothetical protein